MNGAASPTDVVGDPLIARTGSTAPGALTSNYFKIQTGSPVINHGALITPNVSVDHFVSNRGTSPDIGGHEYGSTAQVMTQGNISNFYISPAAQGVKWITNKWSTAVVQYGTSSTSFPWQITVPDAHFTHGVSIGGLTPGTYYYRIVSTDTATGTVLTSPVYSFSK
jgi:hypothetical protein